MPPRGSSTLASVAALLLCVACSADDEDDGDSNDQGNVNFSESCSIPSVCGGDPTGSWELVAGCIQPAGKDFDCDWEQTAWGTVEGTVDFDSGSYSLDTDAELRHCGWVDGSSRGAGGTYTIMENTLVLGTRNVEFCVEGDTLLLWDMAAVHPDFSVLELVRADGG